MGCRVPETISFYGDSLTAGIPGASYVKRFAQLRIGAKIANYGKINDTPLSLHLRIERQGLTAPTQTAFIFVGVNDLLIARSWFFSRIRRHWARSDVEFTAHYQALLKTVRRFAECVICVSPVFIGEDFTSAPQQALGRRADLIADLCDGEPNCSYLDLRTIFEQRLHKKNIAAGLPQNLWQSIGDGIFRRSEAAITAASQSRGLHYTIDGVHLNMAGAQIVADACAQVLVTR